MANPEITAELVRRFKEYRLAYRFTRQEGAEKAGISLITLRQFESGKAYNINKRELSFPMMGSGLLETDGRPTAGDACFSLYNGTHDE